ncbi:hypothetical protein DGMP_08940 [Desulfomarina profundi]|uniref:Uncharacterized protein n=1 Tax=Desulfomarina profundi TaxID=2772557 RepID=A0A8D5JQM7_9BACT|nr:hypothetical protein [Desulfomarina profundi]BCL60201.1 hypothetical protein DGMP_08940 [Desulfomarina profundi]
MKIELPEKIKAFIIRYKERIILTAAAILFAVLVAGGIYLQQKNKKSKEIPEKKIPVKVEIKAARVQGQSQSEKEPKPTTFFLKPSPGELLEQLNEMEGFDEKVATRKFAQLPVMWPVYFFSLTKKDEKTAKVELDVSEDGFGVLVVSEVSPEDYPELSGLQVGKKLWVAGEITAVDPAGTGTVYLKLDYLRFSDPAAEEVVTIEEGGKKE